jgi:hypothetical protein
VDRLPVGAIIAFGLLMGACAITAAARDDAVIALLAAYWMWMAYRWLKQFLDRWVISYWQKD